MSALLSLPRFAAPHKALWQASTGTDRTRRLAATRLSAAVRAGRIPAAALAKAVRGGDRAIAELMLEHSRFPALPTIRESAVPRGCFDDLSKHLDASDLASTLRALNKRGHIRKSSLTSRYPNPSANVLHACMDGFHQQLLASQKSIPKSIDTTRGIGPFELHVLPLALRNQEWLSTWQGEDDDSRQVIALEVSSSPFIAEPDYGGCVDAQTAVRSAMTALERASSISLFLAPHNCIQNLNGYEMEMYADMHANSSWLKDGSLQLDAHAIDVATEELGWEIDDESLATLGQLFRFFEECSKQVIWKPRSQSMLRWRKANKESKFGLLVDQLLNLAKQLRALKPISDWCQPEFNGEQCAVMCLPGTLESNRVVDGALDYYGESGEPITIVFSLKKDGGDQLVALHERVGMESSLISAAMFAIYQAHE